MTTAPATVTVTLRFFASLREALGPGAPLAVPAGATVGDVRRQLQGRDAAHAAALADDRPVRCALDQAMCDDAARVHEGAELAFFPPVTGG